MNFRFRTWNGGRCNSVKKNKKGLSLVVVIVTVLALIIFSAMVFTASIASLSMTGLSTDGRQTYLKAKSAIQYTRTLVCEKAKRGALTEFSVGPDGDSYKELSTSNTPDGTGCYTQCKNMGGSQWKIFALVKNRNSGKMQKLNYTFTLNNSGILCPDSFLLAGSRFDGDHGAYLNSNGNSFDLSSDTKCPYPMALTNIVCKSTVTTGAPEVYITGDGGLQFDKNASGAYWTIDTNFLYIRTKLTATDSGQQFILQNWAYNGAKRSTESDYHIDLNNGYDGIVCFGTANAVTVVGGTTPTNAAGYYYFKNGANLLKSDDYTNGMLKRVANMSEIENGNPYATVRVGGSTNTVKYATKTYMKNVDYLNNSRKSTDNKIVSSESNGGIGWTDSGQLQIQNNAFAGAPQPGKDVYLNLDHNGITNLNNLLAPVTFTAHSLAFQVTPQTTPFSMSPVFTVPGQSFTFQVDSSDPSSTKSAPGWLWLNVQNYMGSPWAEPFDKSDSAEQAAETTLKPTSTNSAFIVNTPSGKDVILVLPHGLKVEDQSGNSQYELLRNFADPTAKNYVDPQDPSTYTYSVPSGTDLLTLTDKTANIQKYVPTSTPIPGGNSYTITDGKYTFT